VVNLIKLKGMTDTMLRCIVPEELPSSELAAAFRGVMEKGGAILPGARIVLDFGARPLSEQLVCALLSDFVWPSGASAAAWITYDASSQKMLKRAGMETSEPAPGKDAGTSPALVLHRSLRSGQRVEHRGDVIISGHVNDGAEVLSSGNITILGRLSGLVHAGYEGDENTTVVARSMEALQVRIGGKIGSLGREAEWWGKHVIVSVKDETVLIEYWPVIKGESGTKEDTARAGTQVNL
jgi:septum site-determining protein MinC